MLTRHRDGLAVRRQRLLEGQRTLQRSDESAYALVLSSASSHQDRRSLLSLGNGEPLVYRELSVDQELFSANVYKRSGRSPFMRNVLQSIKPTGLAGFNSSLGVKESSISSPPSNETHSTSVTKQRKSDGILSVVSSRSPSAEIDRNRLERTSVATGVYQDLLFLKNSLSNSSVSI